MSDNRRDTDPLIAEMAVDIRYIKQQLVENKVEIDRLTEWKLKWEGFKWAWAMIFTAIGAGLQVLFEWAFGRS